MKPLKNVFNDKTLTAILLRSPGTKVTRNTKLKHNQIFISLVVNITPSDAVACSVTAMLNNTRRKLLNNYHIQIFTTMLQENKK